MRFTFLALTIAELFSFTLKAQYSCKTSHVNPTFFLREVDSLRKKMQYNDIETLLKNRIESDSVKFWHYYQLACVRSQQGDTAEPFRLLYKHIDLKVYADDILTDTDFEPLQNTQQWQKLRDTLYVCYLSKYPDIENKQLSLKLWLLGIDDQRTRTLKRNWKKPFPTIGSKEWSLLNKVFLKETKERANFIMEFVRDDQWPTYSMVGAEASEAAMLIIQHCGNNRYLKKSLPLLKVAAEKGEVSKIMYANMLDRYLIQSNKRQIYGTQIIGEGSYSTGSMIMFFPPIEDEANVNIRRVAMGMESIEEWAQSMGFTYQYKSDNENKRYFKAYREARRNGHLIKSIGVSQK